MTGERPAGYSCATTSVLILAPALRCVPGHEEGERDDDEKASVHSLFQGQSSAGGSAGDRTIQAIAAKHEVHPNQISGWKRQAQAVLRELFGDGTDRRQKQHDATIHDLHAKIGELTVERDF